jgi:ornithine cyclodeaminase/alanine dehydrogenase-like protein (mu-crystallin family)
MLALEGASVTITSRSLANAEQACAAVKQRFGVEINAVAAPDFDSRAAAIANANIILATGAAGIELLKPEQCHSASGDWWHQCDGQRRVARRQNCLGRDWFWRFKTGFASRLYRQIV